MAVRAKQLKILYPVIRVDSIDMMNFQRSMLALPEPKTAFLTPIDSRRLLVMLPESSGTFIRRILNKDILICETSLRLESKPDIPALARKMRNIQLIISNQSVNRPIVPANRPKT